MPPALTANLSKFVQVCVRPTDFAFNQTWNLCSISKTVRTLMNDTNKDVIKRVCQTFVLLLEVRNLFFRLPAFVHTIVDCSSRTKLLHRTWKRSCNSCFV